MTPNIRMYCTPFCPYCTRAEQLLVKKGADIEKIYVHQDGEKMQEMISITGRRTVPQIFIGERHVGGFDDLVELDVAGELDPLLAVDEEVL